MSPFTHSQNDPLLPAKLANKDEPQSSMSNVAIKVLALTRIGFGAACLVAPRFTTGLFLLPTPSSSLILARAFGGRDLVLGELLWTARDTNNVSENSRREVKRALWAGIATDALDIGSFLFGLANGTVSRGAASLVGGGAVVFIALGAIGMRGA